MAATPFVASSCSLSQLDISDSPHQPGPDFNFPKRSFGIKKSVHRSFQHSWFNKWKFLHYREDTDTVFCHTCLRMFKEKKDKTASKASSAFVSSIARRWLIIHNQ